MLWEGTAGIYFPILASYLCTTCNNQHSINCLYEGYIREEYATIKIELGLMWCVKIEPRRWKPNTIQLALFRTLPNLGVLDVTEIK